MILFLLTAARGTAHIFSGSLESAPMCSGYFCWIAPAAAMGIISEVLALTRAHVKSLGGNALVSFKMNECILLDNPHRNHGQCLINVAGDAIKVVKKRNSL